MLPSDPQPPRAIRPWSLAQESATRLEKHGRSLPKQHWSNVSHTWTGLSLTRVCLTSTLSICILRFDGTMWHRTLKVFHRTVPYYRGFQSLPQSNSLFFSCVPRCTSFAHRLARSFCSSSSSSPPEPLGLLCDFHDFPTIWNHFFTLLGIFRLLILSLYGIEVKYKC